MCVEELERLIVRVVGGWGEVSMFDKGKKPPGPTGGGGGGGIKPPNPPRSAPDTNDTSVSFFLPIIVSEQ